MLVLQKACSENVLLNKLLVFMHGYPINSSQRHFHQVQLQQKKLQALLNSPRLEQILMPSEANV